MNSISDYLTVTTPLPQYLPYARFLLDTDLGHTAKLLYTLLLDRATLSQKNNWIDAQGRIYVVYPLSNLAKDLRCSISSITRAFAELENAKLVERIRSGFSKPSRILLMVPYQLMISGGDVKAVQGTTGHATADMLVNTYAHIQQSSRVELGRKFEEGFYAKQERPSPQANRPSHRPSLCLPCWNF